MLKTSKLNCFVLSNNGQIFSPVLTTTREYGKWLQTIFDEYTCSQELEIRANDRNGRHGNEYHPGTRIGMFFSRNNFKDIKYHSVYIEQGTKTFKGICKKGLAEANDCVKLKSGRGLRVYTLDQVEFYIKQNLDKHFCIEGKFNEPTLIKVPNNEINSISLPIRRKVKSLF